MDTPLVDPADDPAVAGTACVQQLHPPGIDDAAGSITCALLRLLVC